MTFRIQKQTEAEKDSYLFECFYDAGFINSLLESNYSIVSGRKGAGKTALSLYLEKKGSDYGVDYVHRISIRNLSVTHDEEPESRLNSILLFILIKVVQQLLTSELFTSDSYQHWKDFLIQNGVQNIRDYETFIQFKRSTKTGFSLKGVLSYFGIAKAETSGQLDENSDFSRALISNVPHSLIESLKQSLIPGKKIIIFIDDLTDYLDESDDKKLHEDIALIKDFLLSLEIYNSIFSDGVSSLRLVSLLREDIFEFMAGSNINKLQSDSLQLEWNEKSFASLLIRRLPFFQNELEENLKNPIDAIRKQFPDDIFSFALENFDTNHYESNFYAYMVAISFNRPRDFLKFCYAMRNRLSSNHVALRENIEAAETEYSDYFTKELKDELYIASRILKFEAGTEDINRLIDILSQKDGFNPSQLRTDMAQYLGEKTSLGKVKIESFILELWRYGVLGFKEKNRNLIHFRYIPNSMSLTVGKIQEFMFFLHRGLWWFAEKRKGTKNNRKKDPSYIKEDIEE